MIQNRRGKRKGPAVGPNCYLVDHGAERKDSVRGFIPSTVAVFNPITSFLSLLFQHGHPRGHYSHNGHRVIPRPTAIGGAFPPRYLPPALFRLAKSKPENGRG